METMEGWRNICILNVDRNGLLSPKFRSILVIVKSEHKTAVSSLRTAPTFAFLLHLIYDKCPILRLTYFELT
jgi:hypothetical protein